MNKAARARVRAIMEKLTTMQGEAEAIAAELRDLADNEREKFDALPESLQQGGRGDALEEAATTLEAAGDECEQIAETAIRELCDSLGELA